MFVGAAAGEEVRGWLGGWVGRVEWVRGICGWLVEVGRKGKGREGV